MPCRIQEFITGEKYHVVSVVKDGMRAFFAERDYLLFMKMVEKYRGGRVRVIVFGVVANHGHFLVEQLRDSGISLFMAVLQREYSKKKGFPGGLFRSPFWAERIVDEDHYYNVLAYILRNPGKHKMANLGRDGWSGVMIR